MRTNGHTSVGVIRTGRRREDEQLRAILAVLQAVKRGDFDARVPIPEGDSTVRQIAEEVNELVARLDSVGSEIIRVAREVGTEGQLGSQAEVRGVSGTWKDLIDNVNALAGNLTNQVRNIALVTTAVANGDLSQKITVEAKGEILELKNTINRMVQQLRAFASEVTRVAREVGTEGKLGVQAEVQGVAGTWRDLTHNVNALAGNLTNQVRNIALVTTAVASGDLSQKITVEARGEILELKETINRMVDQLRGFAAEVTRVAREVGTEGKLGGQAHVGGVAGTWKDLTDNVNQLASNLTNQVRNIALVTKAVASGDLSQKITVEASGEILELKETINRMVDQLRGFAAEVTRVAREVGTEGKLGGQAQVPDVAGTWKDLTENVNVMASNLTSQVRGIAKVVDAVANGDLRQKLALVAKGEIASLADTINEMTDTLRVFAEQVTTVAREVGVEGKLGGQAKVPGASGTWRDLTDAVNQLAGNLTTQVRAIAEVATAVTAGDLTRAISVEASGEVLKLKDNINQMIANLRDTTHTNKEQDWLKTNLAKFSGMMQGQRSVEALARLIISELTPLVSAQQGLLYVLDIEDRETPMLRLMASYAFESRKQLANTFELGEGLVGQCALERKRILVTDVPSDYVMIRSGLGRAGPLDLVVLPVLFEVQLKAVIELASFQEFTPIHLTFLEQLMQSVGVVFNMIGASTRTEELLQELQRSNSELERRSRELEEKASELEFKNREIARASASLEEKARELARASKYKSDFLANMSHELRTPLNSLLILASLLAENESGTLTAQQVEFAKTICTSGRDLLSLINEILDLSKVEAGKVEVKTTTVSIADISDFVERSFRKMAEQKKLELHIEIA
ncbi:MAG TPA: HAMP domain-containing protein, partial [Polyangiaceae bacterium]|nr:HAMP domain-containing protein [Polyangiaceae bacterium]